MKKFLFAFVFLCSSLLAQDYQITFAILGDSSTPDSVLVENQTRLTSLTMNGADILRLQAIVTDLEEESSVVSSSLSVIPNPFEEYAMLNFYNAIAGRVYIELYELGGLKLFSINDDLEVGNISYRLSGLPSGTYIVNVLTHDTHYSAIILSTLDAYSGISLERSGDVLAELSTKAVTRAAVLSSVTANEVYMQYFDGEHLKLTAYFSGETSVVYLTPTNSQEVVFADFNNKSTGLYLGALGFSGSVDEKAIKGPLYIENDYEYQRFVDDLETGNNTLLYHSVDQAIDMLQQAELPADLSNVAIVTFTDGLDQGSWMLHIGEYASESVMLDSVNSRILNETINGIPITAYTVGIEGSDISNQMQFVKNLQDLASDDANVFETTYMSEVTTAFESIAASLNDTKITREYALSLTVPGKSPGTVIRFTFDGTSNGGTSKKYVDGEFDYVDGAFILKNVTYNGLKSISGDTLQGVIEGLNVVFDFDVTVYGDSIETSEINQWEYVSEYVWQVNSEFDPSRDTQTETKEVSQNSIAVMLVLDCSSSLGAKFADMQHSANKFIDILLEGAGNDIKPLPGFTVNGRDSVDLSYSTVWFTDTSRNEPTSWYWEFEGGTPSTSELQNPTVNYNERGVYDVTLTVSNLDGENTLYMEDYIKVTAFPRAFFSTPTGYRVVAKGDTIRYIDYTQNSPTSWYWTFEGGVPATSTEQNPVVRYDIVGHFNVTLEVQNEDGSDFYEWGEDAYMDVLDTPVPSFTSYENVVAGYTMQFNDSSYGSPSSWYWEFEGGVPATSTEESPVVRYDTIGTFNVSLTVGNVAGDSTIIKNDYVTVLDSSLYVQDIDGNLYGIVTIGTQTWMKENLKVTHFPDGSEITYKRSENTWNSLAANSTADAYCWWQDDITNKDTHGAYYSHGAATADNWTKDNKDHQGICPDGWHLPSDDEWKTLEMHLGMSQEDADSQDNMSRGTTEGSMLANNVDGFERWYSYTSGITGASSDFGSSGFDAVPVSYRMTSGVFANYEGNRAYFWTADAGTTWAYVRLLRYNYQIVHRTTGAVDNGYSVRCVKD